MWLTRHVQAALWAMMPIQSYSVDEMKVYGDKAMYMLTAFLLLVCVGQAQAKHHRSRTQKVKC